MATRVSASFSNTSFCHNPQLDKQTNKQKQTTSRLISTMLVSVFVTKAWGEQPLISSPLPDSDVKRYSPGESMNEWKDEIMKSCLSNPGGHKNYKERVYSTYMEVISQYVVVYA